MPYILVVGILIAALVIWINSVQRSLTVLDENINNAMLQIGVQLSSRWDSLSSLLNLVKEYKSKDYETLKEAMTSRHPVTKNFSNDDIRQQENAIAAVMENIYKEADSNPDLKADKSYLETMDALNQYESMINTSRLIYNDSLKRLNRTIRIFPSSVIAGILGFSKRALIEVVDKRL